MPIALSTNARKFVKSDYSDAAVIKAAIVRRSGMPVLVNTGEKVDDSHAVRAILPQ